MKCDYCTVGDCGLPQHGSQCAVPLLCQRCVMQTASCGWLNTLFGVSTVQSVHMSGCFRPVACHMSVNASLCLPSSTVVRSRLGGLQTLLEFSGK